MHLAHLAQIGRPTFSFEFFPPKTEEAVKQLHERAAELVKLRPTFASVTYGAGGSTRDRTRDVLIALQRDLGLPSAAHLTCVGHSREELLEILRHYLAHGVINIVALRGDKPQAGVTGSGAGAGAVDPNAPRYAADLVSLIRSEFGDKFGVAVAGYPEGHPETPNKLDDLDHLRRKVDAGADVVVTQLFFDNRDFYDFRERCLLAGIGVPIVAGIMPALSGKGIRRMAGLCGARLPAKLLARLQRAGDDDDAVATIGIDWATQQCRDLLDNQVAGIHFYTLNRSNATIEIFRRLGATDADALAHMAQR